MPEEHGSEEAARLRGLLKRAAPYLLTIARNSELAEAGALYSEVRKEIGGAEAEGSRRRLRAAPEQE